MYKPKGDRGHEMSIKDRVQLLLREMDRRKWEVGKGSSTNPKDELLRKATKGSAPEK